jgi:DNA-binding protein H-NS
MMSIAQFEAENTGQRIKQVQAYKVTQGEVISGNTPYGYRIENKHLVPSETAESVLLAFQTFERTGSINGSLRELAGVPGLPRIQKDFKKMLKNPVYIGKYRGNDHFCEPIIPLPLWERVQELLPINIRSNQRQTYIFSGLIRCAECGASFAANTRRRQRGNYLQIIHQYRCPKHFMRKPALCTNTKVMNENVLERYLIENLSSMIEKTVVEYEATAKPARDKAARIAKLQGKIDKLKELFINDLISLEEYKADKEKLTAQIEALQAEAAEEPTVNTEALKQLQGMNFRGIYEGMELDEKRRFWRAIIKVIWFDEERNINVEFL